MRRPRLTYSSEELAFVQARADMARPALHAAFVAQFGRHDVTMDHLTGLCKRKRWATRVRWSAAEDAVLVARFADTNTEHLAQELGRPVSSTYQRAYKLGLSKSAAYLASDQAGRLRGDVGVTTRFQKGMTPANKGVKRGKGWGPGRMRETQFGKGGTPHTWMPVGSTRLIGGYEYTKISDVRHVPYTVNWRESHRLKWEAVHGPIPDGHALKCLDGNRQNTDPSNWACVPRAVLPRLNGGPRKRRLAFDEAPAELKPTLLTLAQLEHAAKQRRERAA